MAADRRAGASPEGGPRGFSSRTRQADSTGSKRTCQVLISSDPDGPRLTRHGLVRGRGGQLIPMQSEALDEAVSVRADFHGGTVTPVAFRRRGREYRVARVNARWIDRAGKHPRFYFSVTDENGDVYQLQLQGGDLMWWLDMVTLDG